MRTFILFLSLFFLTINSSAQKNKTTINNLQNFDQQKIHFGYFIGLNMYDYKFKLEQEKTITVENKFGFNVGLIGDLKLNRNLNLRFEPGLYKNNLNVVYNDISDEIREKKSTYINLPILLKYSSERYRNIKPFIVGGLSSSINLSSNQNRIDDIQSGLYRTKTVSFNYELGFGVDLYFQYFKFSPSIRGVFSLTNELIPDNSTSSDFTNNIEKLYSRGIFINFSFH
tara:strand:+ start:48 stop:728 length:681 start_codon:yes stop_codon:yes gene_type:complete